MRWPNTLKIVIPGKLKFPFIKDGVCFYEMRLKNYVSFSLEERKVAKAKDPEIMKQNEGKALLRGQEKAFIIALDERGKEFTSKEWAEYLEDLLQREKEISFLIGGAYGLSQEVLNEAHLKLSLSRFTLGHEIAVLVLCEQLYRAFTIIAGEPYHK
ncbi:protein of unknown function DUF163 [Thermodesulfatator indicus DSM 15286]|uniref:Ribosomal RNA large subunit methyltransferase H n=1 Tax=Thermodesulfatator indicus (strain DSM 15286 / JCM 11887 / CIR29812) TaxID=667014 RepID=F8ADE9_THEID|nr:23S rRNA (pseudouridine(1915)-N(3))-methyltransferase RlmH [Thermodesulfatator indicus]AEH45965.1 protein of unknown function DUF163 [Thermodesulfatator indicus DSM 15286]